MFQIELNVVIWLIVWSLIGSTLGFFTIRYKPIWKNKRKILEYLKSICVGLFFALPIFVAIQEHGKLSRDLSLMLAGSSSFAITDLIIKIWPKITDGLGNSIIKFIDRVLGNSSNNEQDS